MVRLAKEFAYAFLYIVCIVCVCLYVSSAFAQDALYGLMCFTPEAAEEIAKANKTGSFKLEDAVADSLVAQNKCFRLTRPQALQGWIVYEGKIIGQKQVVGVSPNETGPPQLFSLISISLSGRTA